MPPPAIQMVNASVWWSLPYTDYGAVASFHHGVRPILHPNHQCFFQQSPCFRSRIRAVIALSTDLYYDHTNVKGIEGAVSVCIPSQSKSWTNLTPFSTSFLARSALFASRPFLVWCRTFHEYIPLIIDVHCIGAVSASCKPFHTVIFWQYFRILILIKSEGSHPDCTIEAFLRSRLTPLGSLMNIPDRLRCGIAHPGKLKVKIHCPKHFYRIRIISSAGSTTKPGRFWFSVPNPYVTQLPMLGLPILENLMTINCGRAWLNWSVVIPLRKVTSSAMVEKCGRWSLIHAPLCPRRANVAWGPSILGTPRIKANCFPSRNDGGQSTPSIFISSGL